MIIFQVFFRVQIDNEEIKKLKNDDPRPFENVRIYAGDSFNDPASARFKNLKYDNIEEGNRRIDINISN